MIPQFSIKVLLTITAIAAAAAVVVRFAGNGHDWAIAVSIMLASTLVVAFAHVAMYLFAMGLAALTIRVTARSVQDARGSKAAKNTPAANGTTNADDVDGSL